MTNPALVFSVLLAAAPAADPSPASSTDAAGGIVWNAPDGCGDARTMKADVARLLGGEQADLSEVSANGNVTQTNDGKWALELRVTTPEAKTTRSLSGDACDTLAKAAALYIALAVDPMAVLEAEASAVPAPVEPEPEPVEPEPKPKPKPKPAEPTPKTPPAATPQQSGLRLGLRVLGSGGGGLRRGVYGGGGLGVGLVAPRVRFDLTGLYQFATPTTTDLPDGASARVRHGYAELRACPILGGARVSFIGCGLIGIGAFEASGSGLTNATTGRDLWVAAGASVGFQVWVVPRVAISLEPAALFSLARPRFDVDGVGEVFRVGVVGGRVALGVEVLLF